MLSIPALRSERGEVAKGNRVHSFEENAQVLDWSKWETDTTRVVLKRRDMMANKWDWDIF